MFQLNYAPAFVANARPYLFKWDTHSCSAEQGNQVRTLNTIEAFGVSQLLILCCNHGAYPFSAKAGHWCRMMLGRRRICVDVEIMSEHVSQKTYNWRGTPREWWGDFSSHFKAVVF